MDQQQALLVITLLFQFYTKSGGLWSLDTVLVIVPVVDGDFKFSYKASLRPPIFQSDFLD